MSQKTITPTNSSRIPLQTSASLILQSIVQQQQEEQLENHHSNSPSNHNNILENIEIMPSLPQCQHTNDGECVSSEVNVQEGLTQHGQSKDFITNSIKEADKTFEVGTECIITKGKKIQFSEPPPDMSFSTFKFKEREEGAASLQLIDENDESELKCGGSFMHKSFPNSGMLSEGVKSEDDLLDIELKDIKQQASSKTKKNVILSPNVEEQEHHHKDDSNVQTNNNTKRYSTEFFMGIIPKWTFHPNKQSEARDLLAVERTQLAWVRTALSIVAIGIAVSRCKYCNSHSFYIEFKVLTSSSDSETVKILMVTIGTIFVILGLLIFIYSFIRFQYATRRLISGTYVADLFAPPFMFLFGMVVCILALALVFVN